MEATRAPVEAEVNDYWQIPRIRPASPLLENQKVGGRLCRFWKRWQMIDASPWTLKTLREGVSLKFKEDQMPPLSKTPIFMDSYENNEEKRGALFRAMEELLEKGVLEPVDNPNTGGYYGRLFIRPKPNGKWRTIIDLSGLNDFIENPSFHMETPKDIQASMRKGMFASSIDCTDAYYHLMMAPWCRDYMRVALFGRVLRFRAMPMGLNVSARVFTKVIADLMKYLRIKGCHMNAYIDDWFNKNLRLNLLNCQTQKIVAICIYLGLLINYEKSELEGGQIRIYVGILFDFKRGVALVPPERLTELEKLIKDLILKKGASARTWSRLIGKMGSMANQVKMGALHRRPIQRHLQLKWNQTKQNWEQFVPLEKWVLPHLIWWTNRKNTGVGVPLIPFKPDVTLYTDASSWGYGATLGNLEMSGKWTERESKMHSNNREMLATLRAVNHFQDHFRGKQLMICSDNTTTVASINKQGGTKAWSLTNLAWRLWHKLDKLNCVVKARHIPGKLNVRADAMSRMNQVLPTEWSLDPVLLTPVWRTWGYAMVDLFATCHNHKLLKYVSPVPDESAWAIDAMSLDWSKYLWYAFPPWNMLGEIIQKIADDKAEVILIAPKWERRSWYPLLVDLAVDQPIKLPISQNMLTQPHTKALCTNLNMLNLHAWRLSGKKL